MSENNHNTIDNNNNNNIIENNNNNLIENNNNNLIENNIKTLIENLKNSNENNNNINDNNNIKKENSDIKEENNNINNQINNSPSSSEFSDEKSLKSNSNSSSSYDDIEDFNKKILNKKHSRSPSQKNLNTNSNINTNELNYYDINIKNQIVKNQINNIIKNNNNIKFPSIDIPLLSFPLFNEIQSKNFPEDLLKKKYSEYKNKHTSNNIEKFYIEHQNDEWFKEKYDPIINVEYNYEKNIQIKKYFLNFEKNFFNVLNNNNNDNPFNLKLELKEEDEFNQEIKIILYTYDENNNIFEEKERDISQLINNNNNNNNSNNNSNDNSNDNKNNNKTNSIKNFYSSPYYAFDPDQNTIFIHQIPKNISRFQILNNVKKIPGYYSMSISDPIKNSDYMRYCWLTFENKEKCERALELLKDNNINNDFIIHPTYSKSNSKKKIRLTPPLFNERLEEDLEFSLKFITYFDNLRDIENNYFLEYNNNDNKENKKINKELLLDLQILYLRRVHGFCYYCLVLCEDERNLSTKCENIHLRNYKKIGNRKDMNNENKQYENFDKFFTEKIKEYLNNLEDNNNDNIKTIKEPEKDEELENKRKNFCNKFIKKKAELRFECTKCKKNFSGYNYILNHLLNKHKDDIIENVDKKYFERIKKENYLNDNNKYFEKEKIFTSMEEYLNAISKHNNNYNNNYYGNNNYYNNNYYNNKYNNNHYNNNEHHYNEREFDGRRRHNNYYNNDNNNRDYERRRFNNNHNNNYYHNNNNINRNDYKDLDDPENRNINNNSKYINNNNDKNNDINNNEIDNDINYDDL